MSTTRSHVKIDLNHYPTLFSNGEDYGNWKEAWTVALKHAGVWQITAGLKPKPTEGEPLEEWEEIDTTVKVLLISAVHKDLTPSITNCNTAADAWKYLGDRFDRDTGGITIYLFRALTNLRHKDGECLRTHIEEFHRMWT
jgi:gag-polypeptide of LTR copia-type